MQRSPFGDMKRHAFAGGAEHCVPHGWIVRECPTHGAVEHRDLRMRCGKARICDRRGGRQTANPTFRFGMTPPTTLECIVWGPVCSEARTVCEPIGRSVFG
ncbi:hypothetical protein AX289_24530 [Methylorubrum populi]|nr:hypothetical protein AX289_24530 [Methylorubrum populi]